MNETARMIIGWIWVLSALGISYKVFASIALVIMRKLQDIAEEKRRESEIEERKQASDKALSEILSTLSPKEGAILRYMSTNPNGATWLPVEDTTALSLNSRKLIYPIWNASSLRGTYEDGTAQCFLYVLSDKLKDKTEIFMEHTKEAEVSSSYEKYNLEA